MLNRDMVLKYISTLDQLADIFAKGLPSPRFHALSFKLMGNPPLHLRGDVKDAGVASSESANRVANRALVHRQDCINGL